MPFIIGTAGHIDNGKTTLVNLDREGITLRIAT
jgi:selenocysteine-specific translation elongation factor